MMHLLKASIGTGILFLPNAFKRTGYVMSITCSIIIGLLCTHTVVVLVGNSELIGKSNREKESSVFCNCRVKWLRKAPYNRTRKWNRGRPVWQNYFSRLAILNSVANYAFEELKDIIKYENLNEYIRDKNFDLNFFFRDERTGTKLHVLIDETKIYKKYLIVLQCLKQ